MGKFRRSGRRRMTRPIGSEVPQDVDDPNVGQPKSRQGLVGLDSKATCVLTMARVGMVIYMPGY